MAGIVVAIAAVWYYVTYIRPKQGVQSPSTTNPGTAGNPASWWSGWMGFNKNSLTSGQAVSLNAFSALADLSNAFGENDGGAGSVSVNGSNAGGAQSSGSGAGVPSAPAPTAYDDGDSEDYDFS